MQDVLKRNAVTFFEKCRVRIEDVCFKKTSARKAMFKRCVVRKGDCHEYHEAVSAEQNHGFASIGRRLEQY